MIGDSERFLLVGAGLFVLGAIGFLTRRNLIVMVLSAELMLHGVSLTLVTFGHQHGTNEGQAFTIFTLTVAACEAGLALSLVLTLFRGTQSLDVLLWSRIREPDMAIVSDDPYDAEPASDVSGYEGSPRLTPAGRVPSEAEAAAGSSGSGVSART